jgi:hypothetical protein
MNNDCHLIYEQYLNKSAYVDLTSQYIKYILKTQKCQFKDYFGCGVCTCTAFDLSRIFINSGLNDFRVVAGNVIAKSPDFSSRFNKNGELRIKNYSGKTGKVEPGTLLINTVDGSEYNQKDIDGKMCTVIDGSSDENWFVISINGKKYNINKGCIKGIDYGQQGGGLSLEIHVWIELKDGSIIDPSFIQFPTKNKNTYNYSKIGRNVMTGKEYINNYTEKGTLGDEDFSGMDENDPLSSKEISLFHL